MAYVQNPIDPNQQQQGQGQGPLSPSSGGPVQTTPSGGIGGPGSAPATAPTGAPAPSAPGAGGQFASLNQYVNANQGNAAPLANQVAGNLNNQYQNVSNANTSALNNVQNQVKQGYTAQDNALIAQEAANPVSFANNPSNIQSFQKQLNDQYTGPQNAEGTGTYQNQAAASQQAVTNAKNAVGTEAGQQQLIGANEQVNAPSTVGLDEAILYNNPSAMGTIQSAGNQFGNLTNQLTQGAGNIDTSIGQAQTEAANANQAANAQIQSQLSGLNNNIANENQTAFNTANTQYQNLLTQLQGANTTPQIQALQAKVNADVAPGSGLGGSAQANADQAALTAAINAQFPVQASSNIATPGGTPIQTNNGLDLSQIIPLERQLENSQFINGQGPGNGSAWTQAQAAPDLTQFLGAAPTQDEFNTATSQDLTTGNALNQLSGQNLFTAPTATGTYAPATFNEPAAEQALSQAIQSRQQGTQDIANKIASDQESAHAASQHNHGFLGSIENAVTHPGTLLALGANPLASGANLARVVQGQNINPKDISAPGAKIVAPVAGGIVGGIYGGPTGAMGGAYAGQQVGGALQNIGGQVNKPYAFGGIVDYLDKHKDGK